MIPVLQTPVSVVGDRWTFLAVAMGDIFQSRFDDPIISCKSVVVVVVAVAVAVVAYCRLGIPDLALNAGVMVIVLGTTVRGRKAVVENLLDANDRARISFKS